MTSSLFTVLVGSFCNADPYHISATFQIDLQKAKMCAKLKPKQIYTF